MTDTTTYRDWLGDAYSGLNEGTLVAFTDAADAYYQQKHHDQRDPAHPSDYASEDDAALSAILQSLEREDSLARVAQRAREVDEALTGWVRAEAALGTPETVIAEGAGLARDTVRRRLGK